MKQEKTQAPAAALDATSIRPETGRSGAPCPKATRAHLNAHPSRRGAHLWLAGAIALALTLVTATGIGQSAESTLQPSPAASTTTTTPLPSTEQLDNKLKALDAAETMDESLKLSLGELYRRTQSSLEEAASFRAQREQLNKFIESAPQEIAAIERQLDSVQASGEATAAPRVPENLSAETISQRLSQIMADVAAQENRVNEFEKLLDQSLERPTSSRDKLIAVKQTLDEIDEDLKKPPAPGEAPEVIEAKRWALEAQRLARWDESAMMEQDLHTQSLRESYYKAKRDEAALQVSRLKAEQRALEDRLSTLRERQASAAQLAAQQATRDADGKPPLVRELILQNAEVTQSLAEIATRLQDFSAELAEIDAERQRIEDDFRGAKQRIEAVGLSKALGQVLLDRRGQLPDLGRYRSTISNREDAIADTTLRQIRYREEQLKLRNLDREADALIAADENTDAAEPGLRAQIVEVLKQRKPLIDQALKIDDDYVHQLGELNYASERVIQVAENYDDFLAERLLWVRSAPLVSLETLKALPDSIRWLISLDSWMNLGATLLERIQTSPSFWLGLAAVSVLIWKLSALRRSIRAHAEPLRRVRTDRIRFTLQAIGLTLLAALPLPLLFLLLGLQIKASPMASSFSLALGEAFYQVAFGLYYLLSFRMICITGGVADRHYRWSSDVLRRLRKNFDWFAAYAVPISLLTITIYESDDPAYVASLARLALIANMLGFAILFYRLLRPSRGVLTEFLEDHPTSWLTRLRHLWFPIIVGAPLSLAVLAILGYVYTAGTLFQSLVYQMWLVLGLIVLHQTIVRWLIVTRRRLALQAALERQAARRALHEGEKREATVTSEVVTIEEPEPDLATLDEQTRRLINASILIGGIVGLWLTWSDVLPAFTFFERVALWHYSGIVDGTQQMVPVTAADVGLVLVIIFVGTIAAKNLPALLEIVLLQSASVSAGARYAAKTLTSYLITAGAALLVFSTLGLSWGQVQWLVAALGVGIGFGLQEIVANFISGIIILFERPVRVGDIVTIGDTTGVVSNISIRATTIRNWDKQELLVPNKEFITGRLLNWTLTDQQNRITIPVGIEYGSDTKQALALLAKIADQHESVLKDPAPLISFEAFGDNALTLIMRCYLNSLEGRIGIITNLHQAIYDSFAEHGIQIAFPQRDVRLFTKEPLDVRVERGKQAPLGAAEDKDGVDS
ncbi:mechanosensitive ion channel [Thiorhodococcus mannitoliphagus]|uniref:Mechanosensitive ion channel n=1 Tax=Thiorhodococcus mannitoliphagus TaxID=329406 RepID=A0A6P1DUJ0_9GAMM|nr:mechanosensitive ion channel domain-containing protein [Thiorhodococcus mannitoliphagus]NEX21997.1 mechanosensitive ion channel [Thiorhodococcus mannitoliphagus]